jgi:hypothetical protein
VIQSTYITCEALVYIGIICYAVATGLLLLDILPCCKGKIHRLVRFLCLIACVIGCIVLFAGALLLLRQPSALKEDWGTVGQNGGCIEGTLYFKYENLQVSLQ